MNPRQILCTPIPYPLIQIGGYLEILRSSSIWGLLQINGVRGAQWWLLPVQREMKSVEQIQASEGLLQHTVSPIDCYLGQEVLRR